jgi:hypothetical protein
MSTMSRHCQNHVQRLRISVKVTDISGSRGFARRMPSRGMRIFIFCMSFLGHAGILRLLLSLCCSNPRRGFVSPVDWDWQVLPVRLCECGPWLISLVKSGGSKISHANRAKIAAFLSKEATARFRVSRCQALSRTQYFFTSTACWLGAWTGTFPPLILRCPRLRGPRRISCHGPP